MDIVLENNNCVKDSRPASFQKLFLYVCMYVIKGMTSYSQMFVGLLDLLPFSRK